MKRRFASKLSWFFILIAFWGNSPASFAQNLSKPVVHLKSRDVILDDDPYLWLTNYSINHAKAQEPKQVIILFPYLPADEDKSALMDNGIVLLNYIPGNSYIAWVYPSVNASVINDIVISGIADIKDEWKTDPGLFNKLKDSKETVTVTVSFYDRLPAAVIQNKILEFGGKIIKNTLQSVGTYDIEITAKNLKQFLSWYGVQYAQETRGNIPLDISTIHTQRGNLLTLPSYSGGFGLTGRGVTIGIGDNTSGIFHTDLKDRIINYSPVKEATHGIHTTGIAAGAGIIDPEAEGVAPGATIVSQYYSAIWEQAPAYFSAHNMTLTNNSYALAIQNCDIAGTYENHSVAIDKYAFQFDKVLHVFAGGNDGNLLCEPFPEGFGTISGGYQPSKNNLVVSSIDRYFLNREVTSASGPVKDGRLKPEISAVGAYVYSGDINDTYVSTLGTSQASPQVLGALALFTERYKQLNSGNYPSNLLLKAITVNGAIDVGNPGPDFTNGFGALNMHRSLRILENSWYTSGSVSNNGQKQFNINVPANTAQLKVMLCWNDPAASPMAAKVLVNDLDVEVKTPAGATRLPLVLDPSPANVKNIAVEGVDRLNNIEQVLISNPAAGTYTVNVKGFNVPEPAQNYIVAYDLVPDSVIITFPLAGSAVKADDSVFIYWEAPGNNSNFTLEYSTNNGAAWNLLDNNIPADQRYYLWLVPALSSGECRVRLSRNGTTDEYLSGKFAINLQPELQLDSIQCPGYISVNWNVIANATAYELLIKRGPQMMSVDTVTNASYVFSGLDPAETYFVAVRPMFNDIPGFRSIALKRQPSDGTCAGTISDNDLRSAGIITPVTGRKFTNWALTANQTLTVSVLNLDDEVCDSFRLHYKINNNAWLSKIFTTPVGAKGSAIANVFGLDLSQQSAYTITTAIENLSGTDPVSSNDTSVTYIRSLENDPVNLETGFTDGFEAMPVTTVLRDSLGISPNDHWDYFGQFRFGRLRSFVNENITISGNRSVSLDAVKNTLDVNNSNFLIGSFNLANYDVSKDEVRCEFSYLAHGVPNDSAGLEVFLETHLGGASLPVYQSQIDPIDVGRVLHTGSMSVTDILTTNNAVFSTETRVVIKQSDTSVISLRNFGNGITIDDFRLYTVKNDVQLVNIVNPEPVECGLFGEVPLTVQVYNGVSAVQSGVKISYRLNGGTLIIESLPAINGKDTVEYTFTKKMNFDRNGLMVIDVWVDATGDTYRKNDSLLEYNVHNQPLVNTYPYFEDFEANNGYWYATGLQSSWEYGTPSGTAINTAASGTKAWVTDLDGNYNNLENSYLYSPCFDASSLKQPIFRMKNAIDIEDCGDILCDAAYLEYSTDDVNWVKLGKAGEGENWYNNEIFHVWSQEDRVNWVRSRIAMPAGLGSFRLRFVLNTDIGVTKEGMAIDDIEIFDYYPESMLLDLFPNPVVNGSFTLRWTATEGTRLELVISDVLGKNIYSTSATAISDVYNETTVTLPGMSSGIYFVTCIIGDKKFTDKILVH